MIIVVTIGIAMRDTFIAITSLAALRGQIMTTLAIAYTGSILSRWVTIRLCSVMIPFR